MSRLAFAASGLDRAAHLREQAMSADALILPLWRGKIAFSNQDDGSLLWLPADHAAFAEAEDAPVFLGLDDTTPRYARDVSNWVADEGEEKDSFLDSSIQRHPSFPQNSGFRELRSVMTCLSLRALELAATAKSILGWHRSHRFCSACGAPSAMAEGGWQRICPSCGAKHFPRTDPVVIVLVTHGGDLLLGRSPGWPEGMYSLLAGFVEPGETPEAAAAREVFEEAGIRLGPVGYHASQPWPFPSNLMLGMVAEAENRDIQLDPVELEDAIWVPRAEVLQALSGSHPTLKPARKGSIARVMITDWIDGRINLGN